MTCNILALPALLIRIHLSDGGDVLQREQPVAGRSLGEAHWGGSWGTGVIPKGAGCFSLHLASGMEMAYSFPQSNKKFQRLKHKLRWVLVRLFWLFIHFKMCMPYFSLGPSGCSCLIRLEGLQFEIPVLLSAQFLYMTLAIKQITMVLYASKFGQM